MTINKYVHRSKMKTLLLTLAALAAGLSLFVIVRKLRK